MASRKVKTAVIGVGLIGEQHAEFYAENPRAELVFAIYGLLVLPDHRPLCGGGRRNCHPRSRWP